VARAGRVLAWIYFVLFIVVMITDGGLSRGNILYPVGFHRWVTAAYVVVCAAWIEAALQYYFSGEAVVPGFYSGAERKRALVFTLAFAVGFGWLLATEDRRAPWAFLACGFYWLVRYGQRRRGHATSGWWGRPYGTGLGIQIPLAAGIIAFGYWAFVLVTYDAVDLADNSVGGERRDYRGVLEGRGTAGGFLDLGTCPAVILRIERRGRDERHRVCSHSVRVAEKLADGQPVLVRGRQGLFGIAVDAIEPAPPAADAAGSR